MNRLFIFSLLSFFNSCYWNNDKDIQSLKKSADQRDSLKVVSDIAPPPGYKRMHMTKDSFGEWLRNISLKKDKQVYLYNGELKKNQRAQFAVLDISVGKKDLQQCADALMRLRAEYLFNQKKYSAIEFRDNADKSYKWTGGSDRPGFEKYLENVFGMCGSASLEKQLASVAALSEIQSGNVFIKGGFPGHAMIVMDVAMNNKGKKVYMLAQSYMPAQDIHIVKNPVNDILSPWYEVNNAKEIITPEWIFVSNQLRQW
jgi:Domain of unknown function (4846)